MKHNLKAKVKKRLLGVYTYGKELVNPYGAERQFFNQYSSRKYKSNIKLASIPRPARTEITEQRITALLESLEPGISNGILIVSPYPLSFLVALFLVKTATPCRITYTVCGIRGSKDYTTGESDFTTEHRVPIVALFENAVNKVVLSIISFFLHK